MLTPPPSLSLSLHVFLAGGRQVTIVQAGDWAWTLSASVPGVVADGQGTSWPALTLRVGDAVHFIGARMRVHNFAVKHDADFSQESPEHGLGTRPLSCDI